MPVPNSLDDHHDVGQSYSPYSSASSSSPPPKPFQYRPPTPHFPRASTPPTRPSTATGHGKKPTSTKPPLQPKMNTQAYARLLMRLGASGYDDTDRDDPPPLPRRSRSSSSSETAVLAVLRMLDLETARADAAEHELNRSSEAVLVRVREAREARIRLELELTRVKQELDLYKLQLAVAQGEIDRAQRTVAEVDRARVLAEERGSRDRERLRKLVAERAAEAAREEGRRVGWREGLERGRWDAWRELEDEEDKEEQEQERERARLRMRTPTRDSPRGRERSNTGPHGIGGERERARTPSHTAAASQVDISAFPPPPSVSHRSAPTPVPVPAPSRSPESISIHQAPEPQPQSRPQTPRARSSSVTSRRSRNIPPDGYVPSPGPDGFISLPPPFEFSQPIPVPVPVPVPQPTPRQEAVPIPTPAPNPGPPPTITVTTPNTPPQPQPHPTYEELFRARISAAGRSMPAPTPGMSTAGSTPLLHFEIIGPPGDMSRDRGGGERERAGGERERIEEWRAKSPGAGVSSPRRPTSAMNSIYSMIRGAGGAAPIEDPIPVRPQTSNSQRGGMGIYASSSPRVDGGPRLPQGQDSSNAVPVPSPTPTPISPRPQSRASSIYRPAIQNITHGNSPSHRDHPLQQSYIPPPQISSEQEHPTPTLSRARPTSNFERSLSSATVPDIAIEPPSRSPTNSEPSTAKTGIDKLLLTPDHTPAPIPSHEPSSTHHQSQPAIYSPIPHQANNPTSLVSNEDLPPGFVPLSPIPTLSNFKASFGLDDSSDLSLGYGRSAYQVYAAPVVVPDVHVPFGSASSMGSFSSSLLFGGQEAGGSGSGLGSGPGPGV